MWLRFDVTDGAGNVSLSYARVGSDGTASVNSANLAPGAFSVRARLVTASGSDSPNAFVTSEDLRAAVAAQPTRGGFIAGAGQQIGFEFEPGSTPNGSLVWITRVQVTGADGAQHDAYRIITSTSITSLGSHSHVANATGNASIAVIDATTGAVYTTASSTFQVTIGADGSVALTAGGFSASLPSGAGVNHL
ncbi:MAG TPA: hypothetical protein VJQ08_05890 [Candidatus Dormibacteraeota bacterium]|nr:hypothetical protein [Candidatus Dormibacteraeota bacterium]